MSRKSIRMAARLAVGSLTAAAALGATSTAAAAAETAPTGGSERALEAICDSQGGTLVNHWYQRVRCQQVPPSTMREPQLSVAELLCESQLGGFFAVGTSYGSVDGSITWICA